MSKKDKKNADGPGYALSPEQEQQRKYAAGLATEFRKRAVEEQKMQREYSSQLAGFQFDLVIGQAFVKGMRDLGYKSVGAAFDELVDNSMQSAAEKIQLVFDYDKESKTNPARIAVVDDGHGMNPVMLRAACLWGGTHRSDDRNGFGRYGYGLPSASVSMAKRFTVYSREEGGDLYRVVMDLDEIERGPADGNLYYDACGRVVIPEAEKVDELPGFLADNLRIEALKKHGTIVLLDKLDKIWPRSASKLRQKLIRHFGVQYRNFLGNVHLSVDGTKIQPIDPLFLNPGAYLYSLNHDKDDLEAKKAEAIREEAEVVKRHLNDLNLKLDEAKHKAKHKPEDAGLQKKVAELKTQLEDFKLRYLHDIEYGQKATELKFKSKLEEKPRELEPSFIEVKANKDRKTGELRSAGTIRVRYSAIPAEFGRAKFPDDKKNPRFDILKEHKGLIVMRRGRQIAVVKTPWFTMQNYDTLWGVELDFSPSLDEEFSINTSKQQVIVSDRIWEILKHAGVESAIRELRTHSKKSQRVLTATEKENPDVPRASEAVMVVKARKKPKEAGSRYDERLREKAEMVAEATGQTSKEDVDKILNELTLRAEIRAEMKPYEVDFEDHPRAPFFRVLQAGGQRTLLINKAHGFYTDIYAGPGSDPRLQAGLELLLFTIGDCELDAASGEEQRFYEREVVKWSTELSVHLGLLAEKGRFVEDVPEEVVAEGKAASAE